MTTRPHYRRGRPPLEEISLARMLMRSQPWPVAQSLIRRRAETLRRWAGVGEQLDWIEESQTCAEARKGA